MHPIKQIKLLEKHIINDKTKINSLIDLLSFLENDDPKVVLKSIRSLERIFVYLITQNSLIYLNSVTFENNYSSWIQDRYNDTVHFLLDLFSYEIFSIANASLDALMEFNKAEILNKDKKYLNIVFINKILECLLQNPKSDEIENLVLKFSEFLKFDDIRYSVMKCLKKFVIKDDVSLNNHSLFLLLKNLHSPKKFKNNMDSSSDSKVSRNYFALPVNEKNISNANFEKEQQKLFGDIWVAFIKRNHDTELYKLIIGCVGDKVMPFMSCPLSLADILTNAYDSGGSISLLALNAIFILINDYNLQYPDFYGKLYKIIQPNVLSEKYRARFFYLLDLFLSSTHLPAYLVCAFIKRLSRLTLKSPTPSIYTIITMIMNLIIRHPNCQFLLNRVVETNDANFESDPYVENEIDPSKCKASESSLWELKTLQNHFHHDVVMQLQGLGDQLPQQQLQINHLFDLSYDQLIVNERKKKIKTVPTNYVPPDQFSTIFDKQTITFF